jgi:hypothetical protein
MGVEEEGEARRRARGGPGGDAGPTWARSEMDNEFLLAAKLARARFVDSPPSLHRPIPPALHILIPPYRGSFPSLVRHTKTPPPFGNPESRMHCLVSAAPTTVAAACAVVKRVDRRRLVVECAVSSTNDGEPAPRGSDLPFLHTGIFFTVHNLFASII